MSIGLPRNPTRAVIFGIASLVLLPGGLSFAQESHIGKLTGEAKGGWSAERGKQSYRRFCIGCHGERGDGLGENTPWVNPEFPKPRNFTLGLFKCRSTPSGSIPLDSDLFNAIGRGFFHTAMPIWIPLTNQQRADLVAYVKSFSPRFKNEKPEAPVQIPPETPATPDSIARGKELFHTTLKCIECHGTEGRGDGPSAASLRDVLGNPIKPYDFTTGERFKCGETNQDLYRIFLTGLDGTPMPSFIDYLQPNQAWDLVHYLRTLQVNYHGKTEVAKAEKAK